MYNPVKITVYDEFGNIEHSITGMCNYRNNYDEDKFILEVFPFSYFNINLSIKHFIEKIKVMMKEHKKILPDYVPTEYTFLI